MSDNQKKPAASARGMFVTALALLAIFFQILVTEMNKTHDAPVKADKKPHTTGDSVGDIRFAQLDSFREAVPDRLQVIRVNCRQTGENRDKLISFFRKNNVTPVNAQVLVTIEDRDAAKIFSPNSVSHYIWIGPGGSVEAIATTEEITPENIQRLLREKSLRKPLNNLRVS